MTSVMTLVVRSSKDPVVRILRSAEDIKYESTSLALLIGGIFMIVFGCIVAILPICYFIHKREPEEIYLER